MQFIFLLIMSFGASREEVTIVFATGQNIVVNDMAICFLIQTYGAWERHIIDKPNDIVLNFFELKPQIFKT